MCFIKSITTKSLTNTTFRKRIPMNTQLLQANLIEKIKGITAEDKLQALKFQIEEMETTPYWAKDAAILNELRESDEAYENGGEGFKDWPDSYAQLKKKPTSHGS